MKNEMRDDAITAKLQALVASTDWTGTKNWRDRWVHEQPPLVAGTGTQFKRRNQWIGHANSNSLHVGAGDPPDLPIDELVNMINGALTLLVEFFGFVVERYELMLSEGEPTPWVGHTPCERT